MKTSLKLTLLFGTGVAMAASSAMGAFTFTNGDLILGIQATGGVGSTKNVFFNLGSGVYHRNNPGYNFGVATNGNNPFGTFGQTQIGNISTTLASVYGVNWYSRTDLYFGVIGNLRGNPNTGVGAAGQVNGDPSRTFYLSTPTINVAEGTLFGAAALPGAALGAGATNLSGTETMIVGLTTQGDGAAILDQATQPVEWANGWTTWNPTPGASYGVFTGGIQQNFGKAEDYTSVDLQRVLSTNTGATPSGVVGGGTYETTFRIGRDGSISAIPEPSSSLLAAAAGVALAFRRRRNA